MATPRVFPAWKEPILQGFDAPEPISFLSAKALFAVDASGSTSGLIMKQQKEFVLGVASSEQALAPTVSMWGNQGSDPVSLENVRWESNLGGTQPENLFKNKPTTLELQRSDIWYLLTDGEVLNPAEMPKAMSEHGVQNMPVVFLISNRRVGTGPGAVNISVGVGAFAQTRDAVILFKDSTKGNIYLIAAKGAFEVLGRDIDMISWSAMRCFKNEQALVQALAQVNVPKATDRITSAVVSLGRTWEQKHLCFVNVQNLLAQRQLDQETLMDLLEPSTFEDLLLICKTRNLTSELRAFLAVYKQTAVIVQREDVAGAGQILENIQSSKDAEKIASLQRHLREAHKKNMEHYQASVNSARILVSPTAPLINRALAEVTEMEKSNYSANILDRRSNRAMRANQVTTEDLPQTEDLDLGEDVVAFRAECPICCSENEIMSMALMESADPAQNTTDFSLNFPLAAGAFDINHNVLSSQFVCFSCANAMHPLCGTIFKENVVAVIPTVSHVRQNKRYLHKRLALAFTGGLETGQSGIAQIFMSVLHAILHHKAWAASVEADKEISTRRAGLEWMLNDLLKNVKCRETFDETGPWVTFGKAVSWAVTNFGDEGIYSWLIRYPVPGMMKLLEFHQLMNPGVELSANLKPVKLLYELVTSFMSRMTKTEKQGAQKEILHSIYTDFNAEGAPVDLGEKTIISDHKVVWGFLHKWFGSSAMQHFVDSIENRAAYVSAIQIVAFALARETQHQTPKGFLQRASTEDVILHTAITKPASLPEAMISKPMKSFFPPTLLKNFHVDSTKENIPLFVTAYGPSCLACGNRECNFRFDKFGKDTETIRLERAKHLKKAYAIEGTELTNQTGLPEPTGFLKQPTALHVNLHSSIVREWHSLSTTLRRAVLADYDQPAERVAYEKFLDSVVERICAIDRRGNIYQPGLRQGTSWVMPSFLEALHREALWEGVDDAAFEHKLDQNENTLDFRIALEVKTLKELG